MPRFVPLLDQLRDYDRDRFRGDLSAGLTVGVMLIPQGMAYALIAGLPPIYGLYASLVPIVVYAFFGTSRQLAVGPVAMVSLLVASGVAPLAGGVDEYVALTLQLTLMVGAIQFVLGAVRFGFVVNFISHPILAGFTSAAALIIGFSQLKHLLGIPIESSHHLHEVLRSAFTQLGDIHIPTLIVGLAGIAILGGLRRWKRSFPGAVLVVVLATLASALFGLERYGVGIVGDVPRGLPGIVLPAVDAGGIRSLLPTALAISLVGFMESVAVAKVYAARNRYEIDANQELIGLGLANVFGAFFQSFPTTGGFSRTAVNAEAGARTNMAALVSAGTIALTLLVLTPLFHPLPSAALASIIMVAVAGLVDVKEVQFLWRVDRRDLVLFLVTFAATLSLGIEQGILVGIIASLISVIHQSVRPHTAVMGRLPDTETYRNVDRHPDALLSKGIVIMRMDASYYFANMAFFKEKIDDLSRRERELEALVIDAYPANTIDSTAALMLKTVVEELRRRGILIYLVGVKGPVRDVLDRAGITELVGRDQFFYEVHEAVRAAERSASLRSNESNTAEGKRHAGQNRTV